MSKNRLRTALLLIAAGALTVAIAPCAKASPETDYLNALNAAGLVIYDTDRALSTGYAICEALNYKNGTAVAADLYAATTWGDVPNMTVAANWVLIAAYTLCPWHIH